MVDDFDPGMQVFTVPFESSLRPPRAVDCLPAISAERFQLPRSSGGRASGVVRFGQISVNPDNVDDNNSFLILVTVQVLDDPKTQGIPTAANGFQSSILPNTAELTAPFDPTISVSATRSMSQLSSQIWSSQNLSTIPTRISAKRSTSP